MVAESVLLILAQALGELVGLPEERAREFYVGFLGFTVDWEHRFDPDASLYLQVSRDGCVLHLSGHHGDATPGSGPAGAP